MYGYSNNYYGHYGYDDYDDESPVESDDCQPEIVLAAKRGDLAQVQAIVESAKDDHERRLLVNRSGHWKEESTSSHDNESQQPFEWHDETALLAAAAADCSETVEYLLRQQADPTLEAYPDYLYHVCSKSIIRRRIHFRTNDKPENYLQNHDPSFVVETLDSPLEAAKRVFNRAHGHLRSAVLLGTAMKYWKKAEYSSSHYSHARQRSGYANQPTNMNDLVEALDRIPPLPIPSKEILATLESQVTVLRQAAETDEETHQGDSPDEDYAPLFVKKLPKGGKLKKGKGPPKKKKITNNHKQYKTAMSTYSTVCRFFANGNCRHGNRCHFRHEL